MTGLRVSLLLSAGLALLAPAAAQWISDKPPVLEPEDYPPQATEDPPDAKHAARPAEDEGAAPDSAGAPRRLGHPAEVQTSPAPGAAQPPTTRGPIIPQPAPVAVSSLGTPEGPPAGTLDATTGGFSDRIWSGSDRQRVVDLISDAPLMDPVLRDLNRRVILTKAAVPPGQSKRAFQTVRLERLLEAGFVMEAGALAAQTSVPNDDDFARAQAKAILYANRGQDACGPLTATRNAAGDVFWLQLRLYCAAISGDNATAGLTRDILNAQGYKDPAFDTLVDGLVSKKPLPPGAIAKPSAVHIFLLQQSSLPVTEAVARKLGTVANLLVLKDPKASPRAKFEAAERAVKSGALSANELRAIADAQNLPLNRVADAAGEAPGLPYFMGQVVLRRAAAVQPQPADKVRLLAQALSLGSKAGLLPLTANLQADMIAKLPVQPDGRAFAGALVLAKRYEAASKWAEGDAVMKAVIALASQDGTRLASARADLSTFALSLGQNPPAADPDRSYKALLVGLSDALGVALSPQAQGAVAQIASQNWDGKRPSADVMRQLEDAAGVPERRGEAILTLTGLVQSIGLKDMAPDATITFVRLLSSMNETQAARALAIEAMASYAPVSTVAAATP
ncbi:hypothetical protein FHS83_003349 [Rhizomicrobium palustre]|uniref:Antifreeze glycopeptide polyprotein n=1 Tax=Rhizomicrobium palustre TaxID=189966 RepID=A0A846N488_9PROT|nr:hypothetical protein [Rhizomicrobium palustre]NIK90031.1 hypothetical protein [Rhizomicrobium palustre]